ncbi:MAG: hypothetical protein PHH09_07660 [Methanoregulaceae archaeon]|nr:hypothetical protein [Methanoregulaceae archaeon]
MESYDAIDGVIQTEDGSLILIVSRWDDPSKTLRERPKREFLGIKTTFEELYETFGEDICLACPTKGVRDYYERGGIQVV